jgi:hypothetical protein
MRLPSLDLMPPPAEPEKRDIKDILCFREDISPFLVHLTRDNDERREPASAMLHTISEQKQLRCGDTRVSVATFGGSLAGMNFETQRKFFNAICLTETPLSEVHCLLDIKDRQINLAPYGLVFLKENLARKGIAPVLYLNNEKRDQDVVARALFKLIEISEDAAALILPLLSVFGEKLQNPAAKEPPAGRTDWLWEREWRYPSVRGHLEFTKDDVFVGLCPHAKSMNSNRIGLKSASSTRRGT